MNNKIKANKIKALREEKEKNLEKLSKIMSKFYLYFFDKLLLESYSTKSFQKLLYEIPSWSDSKIDKKYSKFLEYIDSKFGKNEDDIYNIIIQILDTNLKMLSDENIILNTPRIKIFWFKCLKHIAKYIYENSKKYKDKDNIIIFKNKIKEIIDNILQKFIPINHVYNIKIRQNLSQRSTNKSSRRSLSNKSSSSPRSRRSSSRRSSSRRSRRSSSSRGSLNELNSKLSIIKLDEENEDKKTRISHISSDSFDEFIELNNEKIGKPIDEKFIMLPKTNKKYDNFKSLKSSQK